MSYYPLRYLIIRYPYPSSTPLDLLFIFVLPLFLLAFSWYSN